LHLLWFPPAFFLCSLSSQVLLLLGDQSHLLLHFNLFLFLSLHYSSLRTSLPRSDWIRKRTIHTKKSILCLRIRKLCQLEDSQHTQSWNTVPTRMMFN
jgi:predicted MPP superfamily phosphohydrolase